MSSLERSAPEGSASLYLKRATQTLHEALDQSPAILQVAASNDPEVIRQHMIRYIAWRWAVWQAMKPQLSERQRSSFNWTQRNIEVQLQTEAWGLVGASGPQVQAPATNAEALGMFYVCEGSTMGAWALTCRWRRSIDPALPSMSPYASRTPERWRETKALLDQELSHDTLDLAIAQARAAFADAHLWFSEPV